MTLPQSPQPAPGQPAHAQPAPGQAPAERDTRPPFLRWALWVAIGALILAAIVCVIWVLIGPDNGIIGRAFLTILLLAGFAGVAILDASLAARRPDWFVLLSMIVWVVILLDGALLIWMPAGDEWYGFDGVGRFFSFLLVVLLLQLAVLHARLYIRAHERHATPFTRTITYVTVGLVAVLAVMLVLALTFHEFIDFGDLYWRFVVAITILAAVGTALIPLINALFAPRRPRAAAPAYAGQPAGAHLPPWPTYADGVTPLPVLPDGQPDWNAYYTGVPTHPQGWQQPQPLAQAPQYPAQPPQPTYPAQPQYAPEPQQPAQAPQYPAQQPPAQPPQYPAQPPQPGGYGQYPPAPPPPQ